MKRADAERAERGDPGRRMSPSMENAGSGAEDVADADLRETAGIAGEMRVGRGEMADATAQAWMDGYRGSERRLRETEAGAVAAGRGGRTVHQYCVWTPTVEA